MIQYNKICAIYIQQEASNGKTAAASSEGGTRFCIQYSCLRVYHRNSHYSNSTVFNFVLKHLFHHKPQFSHGSKKKHFLKILRYLNEKEYFETTKILTHHDAAMECGESVYKRNLFDNNLQRFANVCSGSVLKNDCSPGSVEELPLDQKRRYLLMPSHA